MKDNIKNICFIIFSIIIITLFSCENNRHVLSYDEITWDISIEQFMKKNKKLVFIGRSENSIYDILEIEEKGMKHYYYFFNKKLYKIKQNFGYYQFNLLLNQMRYLYNQKYIKNESVDKDYIHGFSVIRSTKYTIEYNNYLNISLTTEQLIHKQRSLNTDNNSAVCTIIYANPIVENKRDKLMKIDTEVNKFLINGKNEQFNINTTLLYISHDEVYLNMYSLNSKEYNFYFYSSGDMLTAGDIYLPFDVMLNGNIIENHYAAIIYDMELIKIIIADKNSGKEYYEIELGIKKRKY